LRSKGIDWNGTVEGSHSISYTLSLYMVRRLSTMVTHGMTKWNIRMSHGDTSEIRLKIPSESMSRGVTETERDYHCVVVCGLAATDIGGRGHT